MTDQCVAVTVLRVRVVHTGLWCGVCNLPSAWEVEVLIVAESWMFTIDPGYQTARWCEECGAVTS